MKLLWAWYLHHLIIVEERISHWIGNFWLWNWWHGSFADHSNINLEFWLQDCLFSLCRRQWISLDLYLVLSSGGSSSGQGELISGNKINRLKMIERMRVNYWMLLMRLCLDQGKETLAAEWSLERRCFLQHIDFSIHRDLWLFGEWLIRRLIQLLREKIEPSSRCWPTSQAPFYYITAFTKFLFPYLSDLSAAGPLAVMNCSAALGRVIAGIFSDRYVGPVNSLFLSFFIGGSIQLVMWTVASNLATIYAFSILYGLFGPAFLSLLTPAASKCTKLKIRREYVADFDFK